ncbi:hypothetical protein V6N13_090076 [Hibiscus sabdariffa]|uniref:Uncharacterized protein n=2 Tax=Hibiscus sabdariffa TaxID=183260 RepID=A0ABR2QIE6_9ROSI
MEEQRVHPNYINASNPFHECVEYCFRKIAEAKARKDKSETGFGCCSCDSELNGFLYPAVFLIIHLLFSFNGLIALYVVIENPQPKGGRHVSFPLYLEQDVQYGVPEDNSDEF